MLVPAVGVGVILDCGLFLELLEALDVGLGGRVARAWLVRAASSNPFRVFMSLKRNQRCDKRDVFKHLAGS